MESPCNTWGPLLQLQEFKEIFSQSSSEERGVSNVKWSFCYIDSLFS